MRKGILFIIGLLFIGSRGYGQAGHPTDSLQSDSLKGKARLKQRSADDVSGQSPSCRVAGPAAGAKSYGKSRMRLILGIIIGGALTIGGAYVADKTAASGPQPMVNWDVVGKNVNSLTSLARDGWKKITG